MEDNPNYYTVLHGVGVYIVALMVYDTNEEAYGMAQSIGPYKTKEAADAKAQKLGRDRHVEIR